MFISSEKQAPIPDVPVPARPFARVVAEARAGIRSRFGVTVHRSFAEAEVEWRAFEAVAAGTGFQSYDWLAAWYAQVGASDGVEPAIAVVTLDGAVAMIAGFGVERRMGMRCLAWLGGRFADYKAPLIARDFNSRVPRDLFPALWDRMLAALPPHDFIALENQPEFIGDHLNPFIALGGERAPDAGFVFALPSTYEEFTTRFRPETRRNDRSKERRLGAMGNLQFHIAETPLEARRMTADLLDRKAAQLRAQGIFSIFEDAGYRAAYIALAALPPKRRLLQVATLTLDGEFLSGSIAHIRGGHATLMVHTYEHHHARMSPGRLHLLRLIRTSIEAGHRHYDLSVGHSAYKDSFCDTPMPLTNLVTASKPWGMAAASAERTRLGLKRAVKSSDRLMGWVRALRLLLRRR